MENIKKHLDYCPDSGVFTSTRTGHAVGWRDKRGYIYITYRGKNYLAHRLAWYFVYGRLPEKQIDHINRTPSDNRFFNLREADNRENQANTKTFCTNKSGYKGVYKDKKSWRMQLRFKGKRYTKNGFPTPKSAHNEYIRLHKALYGEYSPY